MLVVFEGVRAGLPSETNEVFHWGLAATPVSEHLDKLDVTPVEKQEAGRQRCKKKRDWKTPDYQGKVRTQKHDQRLVILKPVRIRLMDHQPKLW